MVMTLSSTRNRLRGPALALAVLVLPLAVAPGLVSQGHAQDQFLPAANGWETYVNERFGTTLSYPGDIFTPGDAPENRDGRRFEGGDAALEVFAWANSDNETAQSLKGRLVGTEGYEEVTYSPVGPNWLVLSGFRGDDIFYEKYFFRGDTVHGFGMEFPESEKPFYAPIVEGIEDSFQTG